jgi:sensor histidine kinase YesM
MSKRSIYQLIPFGELMILLLFLAVGMQVIVLSQLYFFREDILFDPVQSLIRIVRGIVFTFLAGLILVYPALSLIRFLNGKFPWRTHPVRRFVPQFLYAVVTGILVTPVILIPVGILFSIEYDMQTITNNAYYLIVLSLFLMVVLEARVYFQEGAVAKKEAEDLEKELSQIRFEVLKSQINPHFLFNSLNVLSGLIDKDVAKAQQFIDEFSHIYRYVLETIEQPVSSLEKELDFARSYLFLQQIRYGESLRYSVHIPADLMRWVLPPLSLQVVLENAIKHNIINESKPLQIEVYGEGPWLVVKNSLQPKLSKGNTTGLGLKNLLRRYSLITSQEPVFSVETHHYIAKLPLINPEPDERTDH